MPDPEAQGAARPEEREEPEESLGDVAAGIRCTRVAWALVGTACRWRGRGNRLGARLGGRSQGVPLPQLPGLGPVLRHPGGGRKQREQAEREYTGVDATDACERQRDSSSLLLRADVRQPAE